MAQSEWGMSPKLSHCNGSNVVAIQKTTVTKVSTMNVGYMSS